MEDYLEKKPFICIESETYFTFTQRRLKEAQNVLLHLAKYRPSNFGISTGILMHIIRHVCHSPIVKHRYLRDALRDVRFQEIMSDYGMFFLHDLNLDLHCIEEIPVEDPEDCQKAMRLKGKAARPLTTTHPSNPVPTGHYPLGEMPTWSEVKAFIGQGADIFMNQWVWNPEWDEENAQAAQLFVRFTREYFATLNLDSLRANAPSPMNLEDAMKAWTVGEMKITLTSCQFVASNHGLKGKFSGARSHGFKDIALGFFPPDSEPYRNSSWAPFLQHGYMGEYFRRKRQLDEEDGEALVDAICNIFGRLHCLPVIVTPTPKSKGKVWTASEGGIHILANPIFYKLKGIGSVGKALTGSAVGRLPRVKASDVVINRRLIEMHGGGVNVEEERRNTRRMVKAQMARLSTKSKN
jgi:hypothetical protein